MTVEELRLAFAKNLKNLMDSYNYTQEDVAKVCGTSRQIVSEWLNGKKYPRMDKVQAILDHFNIPLSALINDGKQDTTPYYLNPETAKLAQEVLISTIRNFSHVDNKALVNTFVTRITVYNDYAILEYDASGDNSIRLDFVHDPVWRATMSRCTKYTIHNAVLYVKVQFAA